MKVIFLDVDGVLNSEQFYRKRGHPDYRFEDEPPYPVCEFDPKAVDLLNQLIKDTESKLVISSTWRIGRTLEELQKLCDVTGIVGEVIGRTGSLNSKEERQSCGKFVRGTEIKNWLDESKKPIEKYIIIDDDNDMLPEQQENFIKTSFWTGLTIEGVLNGIKILNK